MSKNPVGAVLSIMVMGGFLAINILLGFTGVEIPSANRDFFNQGFGALIVMATGGFMYWVGSSKGSADKSDATAASSAAKDLALVALTAAPVGTTTVTTETVKKP